MIAENLLVEQNQDFEIKGLLDERNERIWLFKCWVGNAGALTNYLLQKSKHHGAQKIIIPARQESWSRLKRKGFLLEGKIKGFFNGDPAYMAVFYPEPERQINPDISKQLEMLQEIKKQLPYHKFNLPAGLRLKTPSSGDILKLASLYRDTFTTYPTAIEQPEYLLKIKNEKNTIFKIITHGEKIISAAGAEIDRVNYNAELTNCATHPNYRGKGLMKVILKALEKELEQMEIKCLYSLARANSFGMNQVFHRIGYEYGGTLINNCHICGEYENMHIWNKLNA